MEEIEKSILDILGYTAEPMHVDSHVIWMDFDSRHLNVGYVGYNEITNTHCIKIESPKFNFYSIRRDGSKSVKYEFNTNLNKGKGKLKYQIL